MLYFFFNFFIFLKVIILVFFKKIALFKYFFIFIIKCVEISKFVFWLNFLVINLKIFFFVIGLILVIGLLKRYKEVFCDRVKISCNFFFMFFERVLNFFFKGMLKCLSKFRVFDLLKLLKKFL